MQRAQSRRAHRLEEAIMHELGQILVTKVQDPRLEFVTISGTRLNKDLTIAEILYTHGGDDSRMREVQQGLEAAHGFLRSQLGKALKLRYVPELRFQFDRYLEDTIHAPLENDRRTDSEE